MSERGTYALLLHLDAPRTVVVGALGTLAFPAGWYLYVGSAQGPGGLEARLARHRRRGDKRLHWHVDYLRAAAALVEVWASAGGRAECDWAAAAAALPGAQIVAPRFGASDCRCPAHLFHYANRPAREEFEQLVSVRVKWTGFELMKKRKLLQKILSGSKNIRFGEMVTLVEAFGFRLSRVKGSHHIFVHPDVSELINLQEVDGKAKSYQIRQFLRLIEKYNLSMEDE